MGSVIDCSTGLREQHDPAFAAHLAAVARTLTWAEESAARGDHADALAWLNVLEVIGEELPSEYEPKRRAWLGALTERHVTRDASEGRSR